jgi:phosphopantetheinyl transferase (holo-ACP synthase)
MREIVARLTAMAADLSSDLMVVIKDDNPSKRDAMVARIERFLFKIRNNEEMRTFVHRRDEQGKTTMMIGLDEHAAKDAIIKAIWTRAEKEAGTDIQIWTKKLD